MLLLAVCEKLPDLSSIETFHTLKYSKNWSNQLNLSSSVLLHGFKNGLAFKRCSDVFLTFMQSKNLSIIRQNFAVPRECGEQKDRQYYTANTIIKHLGSKTNINYWVWRQTDMFIALEQASVHNSNFHYIN